MMPRPKVFTVELSTTDREQLIKLVSTGTHPAQMIRRARILLELDENTGPVDHRSSIAQRVGVSINTVARVAKLFTQVDGDAWATIGRKKRLSPPVPPVVTGEVEARLIALACSTPPAGRARWSLRLLEKHVALLADLPDLDHLSTPRPCS